AVSAAQFRRARLHNHSQLRQNSFAFPRSLIRSASDGPRQWFCGTQASVAQSSALVRSPDVSASRDDGRDRETPALPRLNQTAALEVADVFASGALDHLDGELEQANFPGLIHSLDDRAIRITGALHYPPSAIDDRL